MKKIILVIVACLSLFPFNGLCQTDTGTNFTLSEDKEKGTATLQGNAAFLVAPAFYQKIPAGYTMNTKWFPKSVTDEISDKYVQKGMLQFSYRCFVKKADTWKNTHWLFMNVDKSALSKEKKEKIKQDVLEKVKQDERAWVKASVAKVKADKEAKRKAGVK